ncbi:hypothetical protein BUE93_02355 [Chromobacterium amazonense]|uniref:Fructose-6-phosphate aldolase n=1 Tax=Chromobacterium amazonense TaxID=1382803 RepID=A0A2S9X986_9NEIS|nr:transaldolase family protein [Chromobacterium amazonense]PRP72300.1 hypothetical protein BUE93_02355 [Chromobacterium amazonense]
MEVWLDTIDLDTIRHARQLGIIAGVTTNPAILGGAEETIEPLLARLLDIQPGRLAVQVTRDDAAGQIAQARKIAALSERIVIKIPAVGEGFQAMATLEREGIKTLATTIFEPRQIIMAGMVGASYAAPYVNRIEKSTGDAWLVIETAQHVLDHYGYQTKIMGAAIKSTEQFVRCASLGIAAITLPANNYQQIFASSTDIDDSLQQFAAAWKSNRFATTSNLFQL